MAAYEFQTIWRVHAPIDRVWDEIYHSEKWPEWWPGVEEVTELKKGDDLGVGSIRRYTWKSKLPYRLSFDVETVRVEPPRSLEGRAFGELTGTGLWSLIEDADTTVVVYDWRVSTSKGWMNLLAPLAKPIFKWNHDIVMSWGAEALENRLGAKVVEENF